MDRRRFLTNGLALGCSAAASPLVTPLALASAPWDTRLVVILLRGAMDGLDVVRPLFDPDFAALRPGLTERTGHHALSGGFALNDGLADLMPLWRAGEMSFVHAVSTPYRNKRSHFDGQDLLEAGVAPGEGIRDGWLNRLLGAVPGVEARTAYAVGQGAPLILSGDSPVSSWSPNTRFEITPATQRLLEHVHHDDPLFRQASAAAIDIATAVAEGEKEAEGVGRGRHVRIARFAAARLREETRIASFSITGWDTHGNQHVALPKALGHLADAILTLKAGLGDVWGRTAVVCMTEFGRTARQNGSDGTDHGTGGAMLLAGGPVRGGRVLGDWPGLAEADLFDRRDLMPTRDVRAQAGWVMQGLFGLDRAVIERAVFPGLDLGVDPGLLL